MDPKNNFYLLLICALFIRNSHLISMDATQHADLLNTENFVQNTYFSLVPADIMHLVIKMLSYTTQCSINYYEHRELEHQCKVHAIEFDSNNNILTTSSGRITLWKYDGTLMTVFTGAQHAHFSVQGDKIIIIDHYHSAKIYNLLSQLLAVLDDEHLNGTL